MWDWYLGFRKSEMMQWFRIYRNALTLGYHFLLWCRIKILLQLCRNKNFIHTDKNILPSVKEQICIPSNQVLLSF